MFKKLLLLVIPLFFSVNFHCFGLQIDEIHVPSAIPSNLNEQGNVYGFKTNKSGNPDEFFIWDKNTKEAAYYPLPQEFSDRGVFFKRKSIIFNPKAVNKHGQYPFIVVNHSPLGNAWLLYLWSPKEGTQKLGNPEPLNGNINLRILSINDQGDIILFNEPKDQQSTYSSEMFLFWNGKEFYRFSNPALLKTVENLSNSPEHTLNNLDEIVYPVTSAEKQEQRAAVENFKTKQIKLIDLPKNLVPLFENENHLLIGRMENADSYFVTVDGKQIQFFEDLIPISYNNKGVILGINHNKEFVLWDNGKTALLRDLLDPSIFSVTDVFTINDHGEILGRDFQGNLVFLSTSPELISEN